MCGRDADHKKYRFDDFETVFNVIISVLLVINFNVKRYEFRNQILTI